MASKNQEKIDAYAAELTDTFNKLEDEVQKLKDQVANGEVLNFSGLETQVKRGQDLEPPAVAPVPDEPDSQPQDEE